jgi:hypothetical protein
MSLSRRRAAADVLASRGRSTTRPVGNDETTLSAKTKARAPSAKTTPALGMTSFAGANNNGIVSCALGFLSLLVDGHAVPRKSGILHFLAKEIYLEFPG